MMHGVASRQAIAGELGKSTCRHNLHSKAKNHYCLVKRSRSLRCVSCTTVVGYFLPRLEYLVPPGTSTCTNFLNGRRRRKPKWTSLVILGYSRLVNESACLSTNGSHLSPRSAWTDIGSGVKARGTKRASLSSRACRTQPTTHSK